MAISATLDIHGATWEQYDALPPAERDARGVAFPWKHLAFGVAGAGLHLAIHEPDEPRPAPEAGENLT